jgi:hypothetical protein
MPKRNLRVLKWIGTVPVIATCSMCKQEFRVSASDLKKLAAAQESLQRQFAEHLCDGKIKNPESFQASG